MIVESKTHLLPIVTLLLLYLLPCKVLAQESNLPWLERIHAEDVAAIHTINGEARVTVSDGLAYTVNTLFHDRQRALFQRSYPDRTITQGVEGRYVWSYSGDVETESTAFVGDIVIGHQFHALILFFNQIHPVTFRSEQVQFFEQESLLYGSENSPWRFYYDQSGQPLGMERTREGDRSIVFRFEDWREVSGMQLPFGVWIDDGERQFQYRYEWIKLNEGSLSTFRAPESVLTEEQKLIRLHRIIMDAHFFGETKDMNALHADTVMIVSDGEVHTMSGEESGAMLNRIMASRDYTAYDDMIRPVVEVSNDGTMGRVIAQISAQGIRIDENGAPSDPLEFVCAWIELYQKIDGEWRFTGIVSNFQGS